MLNYEEIARLLSDRELQLGAHPQAEVVHTYFKSLIPQMRQNRLTNREFNELQLGDIIAVHDEKDIRYITDIGPKGVLTIYPDCRYLSSGCWWAYHETNFWLVKRSSPYRYGNRDISQQN